MTRAMETIQREWVEIAVPGVALPMEAYCARPAWSGSKPAGPSPPETAVCQPAVIALMEIFGVNSHIRSVADRLAGAGYVVIAPNYFHRTTRNLELGYTEQDVVTGRRHKDQTTREGLLADLRAAIAFLRADAAVAPKDRIGCVGFCFGGHVAHIAAGVDEIAATAAFYAGGVATFSPGGGPPTATRSAEIHGEILCLFGERDPLIPHEDTVTVENALKAAGVRHEIVRYPDAGHGFFCDQRADYNPAAATDAWQRVQALFERNLK